MLSLGCSEQSGASTSHAGFQDGVLGLSCIHNNKQHFQLNHIISAQQNKSTNLIS